MFEDGTWKREIGKKDQIITLTTKLTEMQATFDHQVASFATQAKKEITPTPASNQDGGLCRPKKAPYTVIAWCLVKKEDNITVNGRLVFILAGAVCVVWVFLCTRRRRVPIFYSTL
jgi:hypothetical protein